MTLMASVSKWSMNRDYDVYLRLAQSPDPVYQRRRKLCHIWLRSQGALLNLIYPGGQQVTRTYDTAGRLKTITDWLSNKTSFGYDADSNLTSETYPNTVKATFKYDKDDQVISIADALGSTQLLSFAYTRNKLSLLASMQPTGVPQSNETYAYTALNQLSTVNTPTYQYDHGDNLTQIGTSTLTYDAANELTALTQTAGTTTFTYDTQGNRVKQKSPGGTTITLTYDQANRLTAYGTTATYASNGDGLRMSKTVGGVPEAFTWDVAESLPLLLQDGTTLYVYGPGGLPLEQVNGSTVLYYHQDQLGSTRALTNSTGAVVVDYAYDAYGNLTGTTGIATNPFRYAGQYTDAESSFQYLRARYYDPATGQFLSRDPLVMLTQQAYGYAGGNPLNAIDPSGMYHYIYRELIGPASQGISPQSVMGALQGNPGQYFPFSVMGDAGETNIMQGSSYHLGVIPLVNWPVQVSKTTQTSFTFTVPPGNWIEPPGSTITFSACVEGGNVYLQQKADTPYPLLPGLEQLAPIGALYAWERMGANLNQHFYSPGSFGGGMSGGGGAGR
jgi:RHS repeat-associated protein